MKRYFAAFAVAAGLAAGGFAASAEEHPPITGYTLDNGLRVVLVPDHRVPKVMVVLNVGVGAMNEPPGRSGFAHLFEHLMFTGTEAWPDYDVTYAELGINNNATTTEDRTNFWVEGLASTLPVILSVEADRFANLGGDVEQVELDLQRQVVLNEMRQKVLDPQGASAFTALWSGLFPSAHPYSHAVIGSIPDVQAATLDEVQDFFAAYYVPNNAVLVLVGDFEVEAVQAIVADTFGRISRGADVPALKPVPFEPTRLRLELEDRVPIPTIYMAFTGPYHDAPESRPLAIAGDLLSNSEYGVFRRELVDTGIAAFAQAGWVDGALAGRFLVVAGPAPGVSVEELEAALRATLERFGDSELDPVEVERIRKVMLINGRISIEPLAAVAQIIADNVLLGEEPDHVYDDDAQLLAVTTEGIEAAVDEYLDLADSSIAIVRPGPRGNYPDVLRLSSGEAVPLPDIDRPEIEIPKLPALEASAGTLPVGETATLSNGVEVVHYHIEQAPMINLALSFAGGGLNDPPGEEGIYRMATSMASQGAGALDSEAFRKTITDLGAGISTAMGEQRTSVMLVVQPGAFEQAVPLLADAVKAPRFDQSEWQRLVEDMLEGVRRREGNLQGDAWRALMGVLFPKRPDRPAIETSAESIQGISIEDARAAFHRLITPNTLKIYSVGPVPIGEMLPALEAHFGAWESDSAGLAEQEQYQPEFPGGQQVFFAPSPGAAQAIIYVARPAPGSEQPQFFASIAVANILGSDFLSRLNTVLREELGFSYGTNATLYNSIPENSALVVDMPVEASTAGATLTETLEGFQSLADSPITETELTRSLAAYLMSTASAAETSGGWFNVVVGAASAGRSVEEVVAELQTMMDLDLADVQAAGAALAPLDDAVIVVAGDPDTVLPQLEAIGLGEVTVVEPLR